MKLLNFLLLGFLFAPLLFRADVIQDKSDDVILLGDKIKVIEQTFKSHYNNLYLITLSVNNANLNYKKGLVFSLSETGKNVSDASIVFSGENVGANYTLKLQFAPIENSRNKEYILRLSASPDSSGSAIEVRKAKQDAYADGKLFISGKEVSGDLAIRSYYKISPADLAGTIARNILVRLDKDKQFLYLYSSLLLGLAAVYFLVRLKK